MQKTIAVRVERLERHARYGKYLRRHTTYKAHDEEGKAQLGDWVRIEETRPLSKTKRWRLVEVLRRATRVPLPSISAEEEAAEVAAQLAEPTAPSGATSRSEAPPAGGRSREE
jgi:small subunit ribosomal protein S17